MSMGEFGVDDTADSSAREWLHVTQSRRGGCVGASGIEASEVDGGVVGVDCNHRDTFLLGHIIHRPRIIVEVGSEERCEVPGGVTKYVDVFLGIDFLRGDHRFD